MGVCGLSSRGLKEGSVARLYNKIGEILGLIKVTESLDYLSAYCLLKENLTLWSQILNS
jgi:hypothetical protein